VTAQPRTPAGTPEGGQFATFEGLEAVTELTGADAFGPAAPASRSVDAQSREYIALTGGPNNVEQRRWVEGFLDVARLDVADIPGWHAWAESARGFVDDADLDEMDDDEMDTVVEIRLENMCLEQRLLAALA